MSEKQKRRPIVGETLYMLNMGNAARRTAQILVPVVVQSVGRKYFKCATVGQYPAETEFLLEDWHEKTQYTCDYRLFETEQEWLDAKEWRELADKLRHTFNNSSHALLTLSDLRAIKVIIDSRNP